MCVRNEAERLGACLKDAAFADEIVVILDRSTDDSAAIARAAGAVVIEGAWELEGPRRNAAIAACGGDWILELDADETIGPALAAEIREAIAAPAAPIYVAPLDNRIGGVNVRHGWGPYNGPSAKACLFRKGAKSWGAGRVHPAVSYVGEKAWLKTPLRHDIFPDIAGVFAKLNHYTNLAALDLADTGSAGSRAHAIRRFFTRFWKAFVSRRGYKEGHYGLAISVMAGLFPLLTHLKAQEILSRKSP